MQNPVINVDDLDYKTFGKGEKFEADRAPVGSRIGASKLSYAVIRLQPGKRAWPYHAHHVIEEMFFVLSGSGTLRHAGEEYPIRAGDFIASPADPDQPHQIINTSGEELVYIALSSDAPADVVQYPDSGKFGVVSRFDWSNPEAGGIRFVGRKGESLDYWDGGDV